MLLIDLCSIQCTMEKFFESDKFSKPSKLSRVPNLIKIGYAKCNWWSEILHQLTWVHHCDITREATYANKCLEIKLLIIYTSRVPILIEIGYAKCNWWSEILHQLTWVHHCDITREATYANKCLEITMPNIHNNVYMRKDMIFHPWFVALYFTALYFTWEEQCLELQGTKL